MADQTLVINGKSAPSGSGVINAFSFDFKVGLKMIYGGAKAVTVTAGAACRPSDGFLMQPAAAIVLTGLTIAASTMYHGYLWMNGPTPSIEFVTTAPVSTGIGTAYQKTGDASRRYIGSILSDSSGNIYNFMQIGNAIKYLVNIGVSPFRVLSNGTSQTRVNIPFGSIVPLTGTSASFRIQNTATGSGSLGLDVPETGFTGSNLLQAIGPGAAAYIDMPTISQTLVYIYVTAPSGGGAYIDVSGYLFES